MQNNRNNKSYHTKSLQNDVLNLKTNQIDLNNNIVYIDGKEKNDQISFIKDSGNKYIIKYKKFDTLYDFNKSNNRIQIVEKELFQNNNKQIKNFWLYLNEIAEKRIIRDKQVEKNDSQNTEKDIKLSSKYKNIKELKPTTFLYDYLSGKINNYNIDKERTTSNFIFPFGFNNSQYEATVNAINNRLSIIEGPPGTGKTQTILNIIANTVMLGKSVAVVSSNNSAIENVLEKLKKNDFGFIVALLGSKKNNEKFINTQEEVPDVADWQLSKEEIEHTRNTLINKLNGLRKGLQMKNELSSFIEEFNDIKLEFDHYCKSFESRYSISNEPNKFKKLKVQRKL